MSGKMQDDGSDSRKVTRREVLSLLLIFIVVFIAAMFYFQSRLARQDRPVHPTGIVNVTEDSSENGDSVP